MEQPLPRRLITLFRLATTKKTVRLFTASIKKLAGPLPSRVGGH
jgi:hypothetical protein